MNYHYSHSHHFTPFAKYCHLALTNTISVRVTYYFIFFTSEQEKVVFLRYLKRQLSFECYQSTSVSKLRTVQDSQFCAFIAFGS